MIVYSEHPDTLDQIQLSLLNKLGDPAKAKKPSYFLNRPTSSSNRLCFVSYASSAIRCEVRQQLVQIIAKTWRLNLNLEKFLLTTEFGDDKFCLWIESSPESTHRYFNFALRELASTKHPAFYSRILRAFRRLEDDLPASLIDEATAAPTDYLVALEALTSSLETSQLVAEDPFIAAKFRGLKRKKQMIETAGGALTSEEVAKVLGISRQGVDKRRGLNQLLALTQGRRGYSYPSFQFDEDRTISGLEDVLSELKQLDPWMQMVFFTSPNERLNGKTPIEALQKGFAKEVRDVAVGYGEQGAL
jgi:hypothetical protein